jgi:MinD superfamily P-loop ATPase
MTVLINVTSPTPVSIHDVRCVAQRVNILAHAWFLRAVI